MAPQYSSSPTSNLSYSRDHQMRSPNPLMAVLQNKTPLNSILYPLPYATFLALTVINWRFRGLLFFTTQIIGLYSFYKNQKRNFLFHGFQMIGHHSFYDKMTHYLSNHVLVNPAQKIKFCATWKLRNFSYILNCIFIFLNFQRYDLFSTSLQSCRYWLRPVKGM